MDLDRYRAPADGKAKLKVRSKRLPRHGSRDWFLKGPVPFDWLKVAAALSGKTFVVGIALWFEAGRSQDSRVKVTSRLLSHFSLHRNVALRSLRRLEQAGLISLETKTGRCPVVTILPVKTEEGMEGKCK